MIEYNSFYGGKPGASFVLIKNYKTIREMIDCFKQGGNYKIVNYDEYVLIDSEDKNDPDNGKIYRRGYDFNNDIGGAIYIGKISGPEGAHPRLAIDDRQHLLVTYSNLPRITPEIKISYDGIDDWVDLGSVGDVVSIGTIVGKEDDPVIIELTKRMPVYGALLIVEGD